MTKQSTLLRKVCFYSSIAMLAIPILAQADLRAESIADDPIVFDITNDQYWYPLMSSMIQMTKDQQESTIRELNDANFAGKSNWRFATFGEVIALVESMIEGANQSYDDPNHAWPVYPNKYFEATQFITGEDQPEPLLIGDHHLYCGRTFDEKTIREDLINEPPYFAESLQFGEGQYHFSQFDHLPEEPFTVGTLDTIMYGYHVNFMANDALTSPAPKSTYPGSSVSTLECGAWITSSNPKAANP